MNGIIDSVFMLKELTDSQWSVLKTHLPKPAVTGRPRSDDRTTINTILFVLITGCRWIDLPIQYGFKSSAHKRFQDFQQKGIGKKILKCAIALHTSTTESICRKYQLTPHRFQPKKGCDMMDSKRF